jgi:hypothetical protein
MVRKGDVEVQRLMKVTKVWDELQRSQDIGRMSVLCRKNVGRMSATLSPMEEQLCHFLSLKKVNIIMNKDAEHCAHHHQNNFFCMRFLDTSTCSPIWRTSSSCPGYQKHFQVDIRRAQPTPARRALSIFAGIQMSLSNHCLPFA